MPSERSPIDRAVRVELARVMEGLDILHNVQNQLSYVYRDSMTPDEAQAHFDARVIISNAQNSLWHDGHALLPLMED